MQVAKYSASGNDFVIFHSLYEKDRSKLAKKLCDRHEGVGADGMIVLLPHENLDFKWQFYNCDGSEAYMCGNGTRATAHYAFNNHLAKEKMSFLTKAGIIKASVQGDIVESQLTKAKMLQKPFVAYEKLWHFYDTGVPHLVTFVKDVQKEWNKEIVVKMRQKYNANVNFVVLQDPLYVVTYERGVEDITGACGTGMAAAFISALSEEKCEKDVKVMPKSGEILSLKMEDDEIFLKGKVRHVFDAKCYI